MDSDEQIAIVDPSDIDLQLQVFQNHDKVIVQLRETLEKKDIDNFVMDDGLVYRQLDNGKTLLYVPGEMETNIIRQVHEKNCHMAVTKCVDQIKLHYWFPNMKS